MGKNSLTIPGEDNGAYLHTAEGKCLESNQKSAELMSEPHQPYLRFLHSEELREKTLEMLDTLEQAEDPKQYRNELGDLIVELTDTGMDYYFIKPLELAKVGFMTQQSAKIGIAGAERVIGTVIRKIIGGMDKDQLLIISSYIRQLMH